MPLPIVVSESPILRVEAAVDGDTITLKPAGELNEDFDFSNLARALTDLCPGLRTLLFDLSLVSRINSVGIREWLLFLERVQPRYECRFVSVGEVFIEQACVIEAMLGRAGTPVLNCLLPYLCPKCGERASRLCATQALQPTEDDEFQAPAEACAKCGTAMAFDGMDEEYAFFLKRIRKAGP